MDNEKVKQCSELVEGQEYTLTYGNADSLRVTTEETEFISHGKGYEILDALAVGDGWQIGKDLK